ncbi:REP element-mobilizing transposase RayT [Dysgonomonas sp. PH5-45]|uniref:transposase n=1 Tax=unclassified Dysgonomonas TaxID=2630389 RepID=UPI0024766016|nr:MULTISPECIES: transposase [unclassified Dysgonomonas]MDH6355387.1 REP element-mobilizing transposase RayT [Dysgonomonas sp. PH5-45]MDH6388285.1 REP element-mobilizing transposase RayT [Dysgonomonas sp. PH5-37]
MQTYKSGSHTRYDIKYHIVWITKYQPLVLEGSVAERTRELIRQICMQNEVASSP